MKIGIILIGMLMFLPIYAQADAYRNVTTTQGVGLGNCTNFLTYKHHSSEFELNTTSNLFNVTDSMLQSYEYSEWVLGYISAFNKFNHQGENISMPDTVSMHRWMVSICNLNPFKSIVEVAETFIRDSANKSD